MTDDIVSRLRILYCAADDLTPCGTCLTCQAADEIERLQEELNTTQELLARCYTLAVGHGPNFDVFDDWEEAVSAYERETNRGNT